MINLYNKLTYHDIDIFIGPSEHNELYKKIDISQRKCFISLSTIPSRIILPQFINNIKDLVNCQTYPIENIFIVIPKKYKRFDMKIPNEIINSLLSIDKVIILYIEIDYGPASKYLGPLLNYKEQLKDNILIVIDDDRKYNENLLRHFVTAYNSYPNITFASGLWKEYFDNRYKDMDHNYLEIEIYKERNNNKFYHGQGLGGFFGFAIKVSNIEKFINYNILILGRIPKSFYHDEGIILGYLKYMEETIIYLKHYGCNLIEEELVDALCNSNLVDRGKIEKDILMLTNLEKII